MIVVSMTSWTKRIRFVGKSIYYFLTNQTVKPDKFYLYLAEEEFPNKEKDLPLDLMFVLNHFKVILQWVPKNTYCHKRHEVFKDHYKDYVIFIDDDSFYDNDLIEQCLSYHKKQNQCDKLVINYVPYERHKFINKIDYYPQFISTNDIPDIMNAYCGQSCVCPNSYPMEVFNYIEERDKYSPLSDEIWLLPFFLLNNVKIGNLRKNWGRPISNEASNVGIITWVNNKDKDGFTLSDRCLLNMTENIQFIKDIILKYYPEY